MFEFKSRPSGRAVARALLLLSTAVAALTSEALGQEAGNAAQLPEITIETAQPAAKKAEKKAAKKAAPATTSAAAAEGSEAGPPEGQSSSSGQSEGSGTPPRSATGDTIGYSTVANSTATKTSTPVQETPVSIQVVPGVLLEDQQSTRLEEAVVGNVSGVQRGWSYGGLYENFIIRGFDTQLGTYRNGFQVFAAPTELSTAEQVEVVKGPASVLYGRAEPGGIVNVVTKKPLDAEQHSIEQEVGSFETYRTTIDSTGRVSDDGTLLYRFIGSYVDASSYRDFLFDEHVVLAPSLTWRPERGTELTLAYEYKDQAYSEDAGIPAIGRQPAPLSASFSAQEPGVRDELTGHLVDVSAEHRLDESWQVKGGAVYYDNTFTLSNTFSNGLEPDDRTLARGYFVYDDLKRSSFGGHVDLVGEVGTKDFKHRLLFGIDYLNFNEEIEGGFQPITSIDIFDPVYGTVDIDELFRTTPRNFFFISRREGVGAYAQDQITVLDRVHLLLGGRYDWLDAEGFTSDISLSDAEASLLERKSEAFTPRAGVVVDLTPGLSAYGSYSEGFGLNFGTTLDGRPFEPSTSIQYEGGFKTSHYGGLLTSTLAVYELTRSNIPTADPTTPEPFDQVAIGEARSRGVELDVAGQVAPGTSIVATYAYTETEITADEFGNLGNRLANVPRHSGSLWGKYEFEAGSLKGLALGAGVYLSGERPGDNENTFELPGYARVDAFASYDWQVDRTHWTAQLNLKNIFDTDYHTVTNTLDAVPRASIIPGAPFTAIGSIKVQF